MPSGKSRAWKLGVGRFSIKQYLISILSMLTILSPVHQLNSVLVPVEKPLHYMFWWRCSKTEHYNITFKH